MNFHPDIPIYLQIADLVRTQIVSGELKPSDKLPSVRELAVSLKVNPNTIVKALAELEAEHLIFTERTTGKFVTTDQLLIDRAKSQLARTAAHHYFANMQKLGLDTDDAQIYINHVYKTIKGKEVE